MPANPYITLLIMISSTLIKTAGLALTLAVAVFAAGADAVCVASAITMADDPEAATGALVAAAGKAG